MAGLVPPVLTGDIGKGGVQQWLTGRRLVDGRQVPVHHDNAPLHDDVEQQGAAQPRSRLG